MEVPDMPFVFSGTRRGGRTALAAVGLALLCAGPASAAPVPVAPKAPKNVAYNPSGCVVEHAVSNPFAAWGDLRDYALAPGGDLESGSAGWTLGGGATVTSGNNPYYVGGASDKASLRIPAGGSAVTDAMCIDDRYPHFRMFARSTGPHKGVALKVEVLYLTRDGRIMRSASGEVKPTLSAWVPTNDLRIGLTYDASAYAGAAPVAFRFQALGGEWRVDDVYVDPLARR
jgi:hypothetical protein